MAYVYKIKIKAVEIQICSNTHKNPPKKKDREKNMNVRSSFSEVQIETGKRQTSKMKIEHKEIILIISTIKIAMKEKEETNRRSHTLSCSVDSNLW